jgi:cell shape-determining protein MreC
VLLSPAAPPTQKLDELRDELLRADQLQHENDFLALSCDVQQEEDILKAFSTLNVRIPQPAWACG